MIKKIKVCSSTYDVKYKTKLLDSRNVELFGKIVVSKQKIFVDSKIHKQKQLQAILHEGIHSISYEYGIEMEENINERLSNAFYAFMLDNKEFIKEIIKDGIKN
jgi:hypothetical protein